MGACNLVDANITTWLPCVQEVMFFDEALLMALASYLILALILFKFKLPGYIGLSMGLVFTYGLFLMNPLPSLFLLLVLGTMLGFAWFAIALINQFRRP